IVLMRRGYMPHAAPPRHVLIAAILFLSVAGCLSLSRREWRRPPILRNPSVAGVQVEELLRALGLDSLDVNDREQYALRSDDRCCVSVRTDTSFGLLTVELHATQGSIESGTRYVESVTVNAFEGAVLQAEYFAYSPLDTSRTTLEMWLHDEAGWATYYRSRLPPEAPFPLPGASVEESWAYYRLIGVDVRREYGWMCEYSTAGMPPLQRQATLALLHQQRPDLLQEALRDTSVEGRVYAADALLYLEHEGHPLTRSDLALITELRASRDTVRTCKDGTGSYRIYPRQLREVLSDSAIARIPTNYQELVSIGWFKPNDM